MRRVSCGRCGKIHEIGACSIKKEVNKKYTYEDRLRSKSVWQRKRELIKERDYHRCRVCKSTINLSVHHIKAIKENDSKWLDDDNLITLCRYCHEQAEKGNIRASELLKIIAPYT